MFFPYKVNIDFSEFGEIVQTHKYGIKGLWKKGKLVAKYIFQEEKYKVGIGRGCISKSVGNQ